MSSKHTSEIIASQTGISSSKIALEAFERHIEKKLNETTENKTQATNSKSDVNSNKFKSF
ncbi:MULTISPECIES: hypothetical protein [Nostocales]|uniref:hypothetical protein n=1 Tax=Nostocales TaxID=1161 RepID=UPI0016893C0E|nr:MULTISPECIES: hypothetical protein [Nostocales]MBD2300157.1 hypothetical protein [Nostoc sp. FACHB-190]MBD2492694.1 hypothetical protein [Aulosira sp. FACHB-615]